MMSNNKNNKHDEHDEQEETDSDTEYVMTRKQINSICKNIKIVIENNDNLEAENKKLKNIQNNVNDDNKIIDNESFDKLLKNNKILSKSVKDNVLISQNGKCANSSGSKIRGLGNIECILYKNNGDGKIPLKINGEPNGVCDHIKPRALGGSNEEHNLQYLCQFCNAQKTVIDNSEIKIIRFY